ncbi:MAG: hypothetical protein PHH26_09445 [Candidatus Thermoplasmatota archaeon]|nr:hypothetical protein [Candidatus Thermoplasmatota archaeon]
MATFKEVLMSGAGNPKAILGMVVKGFGLFLTVTGMVGLSLTLGPLNEILNFEFTPIFGSNGYAALLCFVFTVIGGVLDFFGAAIVTYFSQKK